VCRCPNFRGCKNKLLKICILRLSHQISGRHSNDVLFVGIIPLVIASGKFICSSEGRFLALYWGSNLYTRARCERVKQAVFRYKECSIQNPTNIVNNAYFPTYLQFKGMLCPRGYSELMCYKLPTILGEIFWKFGSNFVPIIILSRNQISTLKIDPIHNHAKFHQVWFSTTVVLSILQSRYS